MPEDDEDRTDEDQDGTEDQDGGGDTDENGDGPDGGDKPDKAEVARLRREAASYRKRLREAEANSTKLGDEKVKKILEALGVQGSDDVDPEVLRKQTKAQAETLRQRTVERAVVRAAGRNGADPEALMDSRSFLEGLADLDPEDADFPAQVADKIKSAAKRNPRFRAAQAAAGSSGGAHGSGSGTGSGSNNDGDESADDAYKAVLARRSKRTRS